jgi:uncharacterized coiled-coil DUF342 family protein
MEKAEEIKRGRSKMTIDEAIGRIEDVIKMNEKVLETGMDEYGFSIEAIDKATNFYKEAIEYNSQIVEWLKELKSYRGVLQEIRQEINGVVEAEEQIYGKMEWAFAKKCRDIINTKIAEYTGNKEGFELEQEPCPDLCKSCGTKGCIFQSGIKREKCDFYLEQEPCECREGF